MLTKGGLKYLKSLNRKPFGFTIVEVMIVLAVTGLLLYGAILLIAGKQNETGFQLAVNSVTTQIQQAINDVANGYYPNSSDFSCTGGPGSVSISYGIPAGQGTNKGCIFLGKVMVFTNTINNFNIYTLAAAQVQPGGQQQTTGFNFTSSAGYQLISQKDFVTQSLDNGLTVSWMHYLDTSGGSGDTATAAFMTNNQGAYSSSGTLSSGSSQVNLYALTATPISSTTPQIVNNFSNQPNNIVQVLQVQICFASSTNHSGLVTIQNGSGQLQATLAIKGGSLCT